MKKILFPTDFSDCANNAFIYALELADHLDAEIFALHAYLLPDLGRVKRLPHTMMEVYNDIEFEEFENFKDSIPVLREMAEHKNLSHIKLSHLLIEGEAAPTIGAISKKENIDFIIMGTEGSSGVADMTFGSVTSEVIQKVERMILSVPAKANFDGALDNIVFLTDFKPEDKKALANVLDFSKQFEDCHIHVLHIDEDKNGIQKLDSWMKEIGVLSSHSSMSFVCLPGINKEKTLEKFCVENQIDLIALLPRKHNFWQRLFRSSFSLQISRHSNVPLMTMSL